MSARAQHRALSICATLLLATALPAAAAESSNLRLHVDLDSGDGEISSALRVDLEREIAVLLEQHGCFSQVRVTPPETTDERDVKLEIRVEDYEERTSFESSVHGIARSDRVEPVLSTAWIKGKLTLRLVTLSDGIELARKGAVRQISWRPPTAQGTLYEGRLKWVETVGQMTRRFACRGGARRLTRQIEKRRRESH